MLSGEYKGNKGALGVNVKETGGGGGRPGRGLFTGLILRTRNSC
jgi:hypothetical protein